MKTFTYENENRTKPELHNIRVSFSSERKTDLMQLSFGLVFNNVKNRFWFHNCIRSPLHHPGLIFQLLCVSQSESLIEFTHVSSDHVIIEG